MKSPEKVIAIVPARSGSKGVKNKNIKLLNGQPLLSYPIIAAKKSKLDLSKAVQDLDDVLSQIQDGRGSFLGRVQRMTKLGGLNPIKPIPDEALKNIENAEVNKISKTKIKE